MKTDTDQVFVPCRTFADAANVSGLFRENRNEKTIFVNRPIAKSQVHNQEFIK